MVAIVVAELETLVDVGSAGRQHLEERDRLGRNGGFQVPAAAVNQGVGISTVLACADLEVGSLEAARLPEEALAKLGSQGIGDDVMSRRSAGHRVDLAVDELEAQLLVCLPLKVGIPGVLVHGPRVGWTVMWQVCSFHAVQAQRRAPSPHPPGALPGHELGHLRGGVAPPR